MKKAIRVLDVLCCVFIGLAIIGTIVYIIVYPIVAEQVQAYLNDNVPEKYQKYLVNIIASSRVTSSIFNLLRKGVALVLAIVGTIQVYNGEKSRTPHILMIVGGALVGIPFGVVGGILGLVDLHNEEKNQTQIQVAVKEPDEETIVEVESK